MELFSILLLTAIALTCGSLLMTAGASSRRTAGVLATLGVVAASVALVVHVGSDHPPGSDRALAPLAFIGEHPTLIGVLVTALILIVVQVVRRGSR